MSGATEAGRLGRRVRSKLVLVAECANAEALTVGTSVLHRHEAVRALAEALAEAKRACDEYMSGMDECDPHTWVPGIELT